MTIPSNPDPNAEFPKTPVVPTDPSGSTTPFSPTSGGGHAFFPDMPFTQQQWKAFINGLEQYFGTMIQQDRDRMKQASDDLKKSTDDDGGG